MITKPSHKPTDETRAQCRALVAYGIRHDEIAKYIGITKMTLYKHYRDDIDKAVPTAQAKVGKFLFEAASGDALAKGASHSDCLRAAMFYAKTQMGWRERQEIDLTTNGKDLIPTFSGMYGKPDPDA